MNPPPERLYTRFRALAGRLNDAGCHGLLVSARPNITYLTGFSGSAGRVLATPEKLLLVSDTRYALELQELGASVPHLTTVVAPPGSTVDDAVVAHLAALAPCRLGFEAHVLTMRQHRDVMARLESAGLQVELVAADGLVEQLRLVKDDWEIAVLREAGRRLTDVAKCIIPKLLAGVTERRLAGLIDWELSRKGFDRPAFDTIVAAGPHGARPHHRPGDRPLAAGDLVVVDFGGFFRGYAVDMTRTVVVGEPTARQRACWASVWQAQQRAFASARVGVDAEAVDEAARSSLAADGLAERFDHGVGHGLGLEVHERPRLSRRRPGADEGPLRAGMVFTLEPGVYVPGWGGIRIEDDVLAAEAGPEWLTEPVGELQANQ